MLRLEIVEENDQKPVSSQQYIAFMAQLDKLKAQYADVVGRLSKLEQICGHKVSLEPQEDELVELESDLTVEEVKKEISAYLDIHKNARTSDIIFDLGIDPELVVEALNSLEEAGLVEGREISAAQKKSDYCPPTGQIVRFLVATVQAASIHKSKRLVRGSKAHRAQLAKVEEWLFDSG